MTTKTIKELQFSGLSGDVYVFTTPYAICSTDASIAEKVASVTPGSNFSLETGSRVTVKFTVANTASNPTLNVNSTGAKAIYYGDSAIPSGNLTAGTYEFVYNGAQWDIVGDINTMTGYSKPSSTSPIEASDTINIAIGKLEKSLDGVDTLLSRI